jgi:hypothetical protein
MESKHFPLVAFGGTWPDLAEFGFGVDYPWTGFPREATGDRTKEEEKFLFGIAATH